LHDIPSAVVSERMKGAFERLGLASAADSLYMHYSSGMRRRLDLARVMVCDPPVLLLDEPTASLDPGSADPIRARVAAERERGKTVVLVTHNLLEAERLCDRLAILDRGRLRAVGTLGELRQGHAGCTVEVGVAAADAVRTLASALAGAPGVQRVE